MRREFTCAGLRVSTLWHCFGNVGHHAPIEVVRGLLAESGTNVLPINTHALSPGTHRSGLQLGFSGVTWDQLRGECDTSGMIPLLNINHRLSADDAVTTTEMAVDLTGVTEIKLEVLNPDLRTSNDAEVVAAAERLIRSNPGLLVFPLVSNDPGAVERLVTAGCPLVRVMGGEIGGNTGIGSEAAFTAILRLGIPIVADGGLGSARHALRAMALGASGVLINSMLFSAQEGPVAAMRAFVREFFAEDRT